MKKDSFQKKLAAYIVMSEAFLLAHPFNADAQIMYTDVNPDLVISNGYFNLDLNNDGVVDFKLEHIENHVNGSINWGDQYLANLHCLNNNGAIGTCSWYGLVSDLNPGYSINQNAIFCNGNILHRHIIAYQYNYTSAHSTSTNEYTIGNFSGADGYLGLKIISNGSTYYGWARLVLNDHQIVLKDYAFNLTPDSSILAGETNGCQTGIVSILNVNYLCPNSVGEIKVHNALNSSFQWSFNNQLITGATDSVYIVPAGGFGNYSVFVSNASCAYLFNNILIDTMPQNPGIIISHTDENCYNMDGSASVSVLGNAADCSFIWNTGATTQSINNLSAGTYEVTATYCNGAIESDQVAIYDIAPVLAEQHFNTCASPPNGIINLIPSGGVPPYQYTWNNGASNQNLFFLSPGTYSVTVSDQVNCVDSMEIIILSNTPVLYTLQTDSICQVNTGFIHLTAAGGSGIFTYLWNTGATSPNLDGLNGGTYSVTVTSSTGCTSTLNLILLNRVPKPIITVNYILYSSYSGTNQWYFNSLLTLLTGQTLNYLLPISNGYYWVKAIYPNGCSNISDSVYVGFISGIENTDASFISVEVDNKNLLIHLTDNSLLGNQIEIINELGQLVTTVTVTNQNPSADLSALPAGFYFFHIRSKQKTYSGKFFIE